MEVLFSIDYFILLLVAIVLLCHVIGTSKTRRVRTVRGSILLYFDCVDASKIRKKATLSMRAYLSVREQEKLSKS